jgi:hypothetical protein
MSDRQRSWFAVILVLLLIALLLWILWRTFLWWYRHALWKKKSQAKNVAILDLAPQPLPEDQRSPPGDGLIHATQHEVLRQVNLIRQAYSLPPMRYDHRLFLLAVNHSARQVNEDSLLLRLVRLRSFRGECDVSGLVAYQNGFLSSGRLLAGWNQNLKLRRLILGSARFAVVAISQSTGGGFYISLLASQTRLTKLDVLAAHS